MKRNLSFALAIALALSFSAFAWAQQPATTTNKQAAAPAKTEPKMEHKDKTAQVKLNKEEITALQHALSKDSFYKGTANGIIDAPTKQAIRDYQKANKLKVTGEPNKETLDKLGIVYSTHHAKPVEEKKQPEKKS